MGSLGSVSHKSGGLPDTVPKHQRCKGSLRGSAEGLLKGDLGPLQTHKGTVVNPFKLTVTTKELFLSSHKYTSVHTQCKESTYVRATCFTFYTPRTDSLTLWVVSQCHLCMVCTGCEVSVHVRATRTSWVYSVAVKKKGPCKWGH